jgi:hypothetical protein
LPDEENTVNTKRFLAVAVLAIGLIPVVAARRAAGATILSNDSCLRALLAFRTPLAISPDGQLKTVLDPAVPKNKDPKPLADFQSPLPPVGWFQPEFDDSSWDRQRSPVEVAPEWWSGNTSLHSATSNSILHLRWRFAVGDPARAGDLKLAVEYVGGLVVYLNGREVVRRHLPAGEIRPDTLADKYPDDLYCEPGGKFLQAPWPGQEIKKDLMPHFERRYRRIAGLAVPAGLLRKGGNVLALEIHRAAINQAAIAAERKEEGAMYTRPGIWAYAGLKSIELTSDGDGAAPNVARPSGIQLWNVAPWETVTSFDYGDPQDALQPVTLSAVKNSVFSGRLAVSSGQAIEGLRVSVGELTLAGGGNLPAAAVRVRYAEPAVPEKCWTPPQRYNGLVDAIPAEIPVVRAPPPREDYLCRPISRPSRTSGAVASLWLTVRVPKDAKAGKYQGTITVAAEGLPATAVPLEVMVHDWALPDPKDFRLHNLIFVSQEAVARHYGVPLWSPRHFELMGRSLDLLAAVNSREIPVNLCIDFYGLGGNSESMVRWIKQPDGSFKYDFTVFDKYLDLVAKHCGRPCPLRLNCWGEVKAYREYEKQKLVQHSPATGVSVLDPASGKLERMDQPCPGTRESFDFWKPVLDTALKKIAARGWLDAAALGHNSYCYEPAREVVGVGKQLWPDGVWAYTAHNGTLGGSWKTTEAGVTMPIKYAVCVWTEGRVSPRGYRELLKPRPGVWCNTARSRHWDASPLAVVRNLPEEMSMRGHDGVGDFGADLFPLKNPNGKGYFCLGNGRGTGGPNDAQRAILAPGPDGPVATERFENFREGVELTEVLLFLEKALQAGTLSEGLAEKVNRCLDQRSEVFRMYWYQRGWNFINRWSPAGQTDRDRQLLALAAEVAVEVRNR